MSVVVSGRTRESQDLHSTPTHPHPQLSYTSHIPHLPPRLLTAPLPPRPVRHPPHPDGPSGPVATRYELARGAKKGTCVHALLTCTLAPQPHARTHAWMHSMHDSAQASKKLPHHRQLFRKVPVVRPLAPSAWRGKFSTVMFLARCKGLGGGGGGGAYAYGGVGWLLLMLVAAGRWYVAGCKVRSVFSW
jgi:hypothetical protein